MSSHGSQWVNCGLYLCVTATPVFVIISPEVRDNVDATYSLWNLFTIKVWQDDGQWRATFDLFFLPYNQPGYLAIVTSYLSIHLILHVIHLIDPPHPPAFARTSYYFFSLSYGIAFGFKDNNGNHVLWTIPLVLRFWLSFIVIYMWLVNFMILKPSYSLAFNHKISSTLSLSLFNPLFPNGF